MSETKVQMLQIKSLHRQKKKDMNSMDGCGKSIASAVNLGANWAVLLEESRHLENFK
jgi:hypothetical protein